MKYTLENLVKALDSLPKDILYEYPHKGTKSQIRIVSVTGREGPIELERKTLKSTKRFSVSSTALWRVANAIQVGVPLSLERVLGASYNFRSSLEALILHIPAFYLCYPGRVEAMASGVPPTVKRGHKHILWIPDDPHTVGQIHERPTTVTISEIPTNVSVYETILLPDIVASSSVDIAVKRRHAQIQLALVSIGSILGFRTYVAKNDQHIKYKGKAIRDMDNVVTDLKTEQLANFGEAAKAGKLIDCVWFKNGKLMPAVMEIEHSTGITSGLTRMNNFRNYLPKFPTRWTIVAPDSDREKVFRKASKPQFKAMATKFFSYSAVEELHSLCERRKIRGVDDTFLDCFMEDACS